MVSVKKIQQVDQLFNLLHEAPHFVLVKYEKTTHQALEQLRKELKKTDAKVRIVKNSLLEKAFSKLSESRKGLKEITTKVFPLTGNTALLTLGSDYAKGLSAFFKFAQSDQTLSFKFGLLDSVLHLQLELEKMAQLPSREELVAKLVGSLKSPTSKLVYSLKFNISKLEYVLKERAK